VDKPGPPPRGTRNVSQAVADLIAMMCATQTQIQQVVTILAPRGLERRPKTVRNGRKGGTAQKVAREVYSA
jgi:hypothetical protein